MIMLLKCWYWWKKKIFSKEPNQMNILFPLSSKTECRFPLLYCFFELLKAWVRVHIFWSRKYVAFSTIRNCMQERDMEFRPFYLFVKHFDCNLKIHLRNSVITSFKVLNISIAGCRIFWWVVETDLTISYIKAISMCTVKLRLKKLDSLKHVT